MRKAACLLMLVFAAWIAFPSPVHADELSSAWICSALRAGKFVTQPVLREVKCVVPNVVLHGLVENEVIQSRIEDEFELALRKAGIVVTEYEKDEKMECPTLTAMVSAVEDDNCLSFLSTCKLNERVSIKRGGQNYFLHTFTWQTRPVYGLAVAATSKSDLVSREVGACADAFANDYVAANPPKGPVTDSKLPEKRQGKPEAKSD